MKVLAGEDDKYLYEHEGSWRVPEEDDVADSADRGDGGDGSVQVGFESAPEQGMLQRFIGLFKSGPSELPLCDKGIECELAHDLEHMKGMRHLCLHGRSCRQRDDAEHMKQFVHLEKPECPSGGHCALLSDVDHRAKFHHSNMWDLLRPCRYGRACRKIQKDQAHCWQYHHDRVSYDLTEQGLRLVQKAGSVGSGFATLQLMTIAVQSRSVPDRMLLLHALPLLLHGLPLLLHGLPLLLPPPRTFGEGGDCAQSLRCESTLITGARSPGPLGLPGLHGYGR